MKCLVLFCEKIIPLISLLVIHLTFASQEITDKNRSPIKKEDLEAAISTLPLAHNVNTAFLCYAYEQCHSTPFDDLRRAYSPDMTKMAIQTNDSIWIIDGKNQTVSQVPNTRYNPVIDFVDDFCFSADGNNLLLIRCNRISAFCRYDIVMLKEYVQEINEFCQLNGCFKLFNPTALTSASKNSVYIYDGVTVQQFKHPGHIEYCSISPDQKKILMHDQYQLWLATRYPDHYKIEEIDIPKKEAADPISSVFWLPDSNHIVVFVNGKTSDHRLQLFNCNTTQWKTVFENTSFDDSNTLVCPSYSTPSALNPKPVSCSADGSHLLFSTYCEISQYPYQEGRRIYCYNLVIGKLKQLDVIVGRTLPHPPTVLISPDGTQCCAQIESNMQKFIFTLQNLLASHTEDRIQALSNTQHHRAPAMATVQQPSPEFLHQAHM